MSVKEIYNRLDPYYTHCYGANFTSGSIYEDNLRRVLFSLPGTNNGRGFFKASVGSGKQSIVHATALCVPEVSQQVCVDCVTQVISYTRSLCDKTTSAYSYNGPCSVSYYKLREKEHTEYLIAKQNPSPQPLLLTEHLKDLMFSLAQKAADGGSMIKYASGELTTPMRIYVQLQCRPDLTSSKCRACLVQEIANVYLDHNKNFSHATGGSLMLLTCYIRFDTSPLVTRLHQISSPAMSPQAEPPKKNKKSKMVIIIAVGIVVAIVVIITLATVAFFWMKKNHKSQMTINPKASHALFMNYDVVRRATADFSMANKLGSGGFGSVYKGMLGDGMMIAAKRFFSSAINDAINDDNFMDEVDIHSRLRHRNVVKFLGYSIEKVVGTKRIERAIILELLPNGSLSQFLFDASKRSVLHWERRQAIINNVAHALHYLHHGCIEPVVHRDVKAANIMLDDKYVAKLGDFGISRRLNTDESRQSTSRLAGTPSYMSPEFRAGVVSFKTDVYAYGILVLEIITAKRSRNSYEFRKDIFDSWHSNSCQHLIDQCLRGDVNNSQHISKCIQIALLCTNEVESSRPHMGQVIAWLGTSLATGLPVVPPPVVHQGTPSTIVQTVTSATNGTMRVSTFTGR